MSGRNELPIVIPLLHLFDNIDAAAPYIKHSFWHEECETRALLSIKKNNPNASQVSTLKDGSGYFDLQISTDCINHVILGPEFSKDDLDELTSIHGKISFLSLATTPSEGTGVITNR